MHKAFDVRSNYFITALVAIASAILCLPINTSAQAQDSAKATTPEQSQGLVIQSVPIAYPNPLLAPKILIEFSYLVNQSGLEFLPDSATGEYLGAVFAQVTLYDSMNTAIDSVNEVFRVRENKSASGAYKIPGKLSMLVSPGRYTAELNIMDVVSKREATKYFTISAPKPATGELMISGIEIAHYISKVGPDHPKSDALVKNGFKVAPNPPGLVSIENPDMAIYVEAYNLTLNDSGKSRMGIRTELQPAGAKIPYILDESYVEPSGSSVVYCRILKHQMQFPGPATLRVIFTDAIAGVTDTSSRDITFFSNNAELQNASASASGVSKDKYKSLSHQQRVDMAFWLLTPRKRDLLKSLSKEGQEQFLDEFWRENDPDPLTDANEYRAEIIKRFELANAKFSQSSANQNGWRSDPGRILMQYGAPDETIEMVAPPIDNDVTSYDPWMRWNYNQGGIYFIFANEQGYGDWYLRHSNAQGEHFDRQIEEAINKVFGN